MRSIWARIFKPRGWVVKWLVFLTLLAIVVLNAGGQFEEIRQVLDAEAWSVSLGEFRISAYRVLNVLLTVAVVIWITGMIADFAAAQIKRVGGMRPSTRELIVKLSQIGIYVVAALVALDMVGLDLTTLTVFSGAVGIGVGFGLQKIASNFISGLILLMEKSIEVGDLVELADGTFGFVRRNGARYTLVETLENKEILIPNEDFITNRVTNWTFTNNKARIEIPVGVAYGSDLEKVYDILLEAAKAHPRSSKEQEPVCFLRAFGESSIDFLLYFWVDDVENGRWGAQSDVMFTIWHKFAEHDITIPFPQRDLHLKSAELLEVLTRQARNCGDAENGKSSGRDGGKDEDERGNSGLT